MRNSIMDSICEFISGCPHLNSKLPFYLDYVGAEDCYCIGSSPNYPFRNVTRHVKSKKSTLVEFSLQHS